MTKQQLAGHIPESANRQEEAEFWDTHDITDFTDELRPVQARFARSLMDPHPIGVVAAIYRYPVKSMRGEAVAETRLGWPGLDGDRRYAFVRSANRSGFPWLTAREVPDLLRYAPYFDDAADVGKAAVRVRTPEGRDLAVDSPELCAELAERYGGAVHLMRVNRGTFDSVGVSVLSRETLTALSAAAGTALDARRFRPNIVVETGGAPFAEETWLGGALVFGDGPAAARLRVQMRIERCMMINLDPDRATQDPAVLRTVAQTRDTCAAVGAAVEARGSIRVGDRIYLQAAE